VCLFDAYEIQTASLQNDNRKNNEILTTHTCNSWFKQSNEV